MDFLEVLQARLQEILAERSAVDETLERLLATPANEQRSDLTDEEATKFAELREQLKDLDGELDHTNQRIADITSHREARAAAEQMATVQAARTGGARVTSEPSTYQRRGEHNFFRDMLLTMRGAGLNPGAAERLARNAREMEQRAGTTANFAGLVPPQYLLDLFAPFLHAGRVTANLVRSVPLPSIGTSFNLGRGTTSTAIGVQATENATLTTADYDDTLLTFNLATIGGYADMSRQEVERGVGTEDVIMQDLAATYASVLNDQVVKGTGSSGQLKGLLSASGVQSITYTDASPTVPEIWPKLADAIQQINTNRMMPATAIIMHPRRWGWFSTALDTANRPLFGINGVGGDLNNLVAGDPNGVQRAVGTLMGLPVYVDPSIPTNLGAGTNEDRIIILRGDDALLFEEPADGVPIRVQYLEPGANSLTIRVVAYGYAAFTAERYANAISIISGTGLITPTF